MPAKYFETSEVISLVQAIVNQTAALRYFVGLLLHPNQSFCPTVLRHAENLEFFCNELEYAMQTNQYSHIRLGIPDAAQPMIDEKTIADCIKRLAYLNGKIEEANGHTDTFVLQTYEQERDFIIKFLGRSRNKQGKPYNFKTMRESDYRCVFKALMRLIEKVKESDPILADYIKTHLTTGMSFMWWE